jgi:hypothetical protein
MKKEYDFSKAERGKFFRKGAHLRLPIYLDTKLQDRLEKIAAKKHQPMGAMLDQMIRREVALLQQPL